MNRVRNSYWSGLALLAAVGVGGTAAAGTEQPSNQELLDKVNALQAQVEQLKSQQQLKQDLDRASGEKSTADAVKVEADRQSQLLSPEGFSAGYTDGKFIIQSPDGRYLLHTWLQLQFRDVTNYRENAQHNGRDNDTQNGFEIRRLKFGFDGNAITPDLTYFLQFAVDRKTGVLSLEQAFGKYRLPNTGGLYIKGGQYKEPLDHEQLLASRYLTAVDRTLSNDLFSNSEGFVQGVSLGFDNNGAVRGEFAFTDGQRSANTNFQDFSTTPADWGVAARAEYKVTGNWSDYDRTTGAYDTKSDFLVFGAGADYTEAGDTNSLVHVIDGNYGNKNGLGVYGAYTGRAFQHAAIGSIGTNGGTTGKTVGTDGYDWSLRGQVSYAIDTHWEPYVQYEYIHLDHSNLPSGVKNDIQVFRAGVNYYFHGTQARLTFDLNYLPDGSPVSDDGIGILATGASTKTSGISHGGGNEFIARAQFQIAL
ncbi:MAG: phosphate-selective porin family protein [Phycisphaerales bacterium]|nr:phosphate-selective porin family protein [Phycisphaerales bacterium]MDB5358533.1 phosphate-selective porin family protein [Phycisphaerales bacterium]